MTKRMLIMIAAVTLVIGGLLGFKYMMAYGTKQYLASQPPPVQTVSTVKAEAQEWQPELFAVGSLRAINGADLAAELPGVVEKISFESGSDVEQGALLVQLRADDSMAQLRALEAAAALAQVTLDRDLKQLKGQAVSQATVDADTANLNSAKAQVDAQRAIVEKKAITAPFKGRLGIRQVDVGQFVNAGTPLVTLQQLDPLFIDFNLPEHNLPEIAVGQKVTAKIDAFPDRIFEGEVSAVDAKVDEATHNFRARAIFKNPDFKLLPGMFAHVSVASGNPEKRITLPQTTITYNPYGNTVFVVGKDAKDALVAKQTFVKLGPTRGDQVSILSGVNEGDEVVSSGQLKLRNGTPVAINNEIQPKNDPAPKPEDK